VGLTAKEGANALLGIPGGNTQVGCVIFLVEVTHGPLIPFAPANEYGLGRLTDAPQQGIVMGEIIGIVR